jgi:ElaB/YqjD/DUF883 family membrane-anchored ribosome-binding protein
MGFAFLSRLAFGGRRATTASRTAVPPSFRPSVEGLEDRVVPAGNLTASLPLAVHDLHVTGTGADQALEGTLTLAGKAATSITGTLSTVAPAAAQGECPILDLHLDPIHLNLLGLHVDTSAICLDVTATNHQGLLGGLLCDLQQGGLDLGGILGQLNQIGTSVDTLLNDLDQLLTNVLSRSMNVTNVLNQPVGGAAQPAADPASCDILNLSLGPVTLRVPLLGVNVFLNDCDDPAGPVTVDVTAVPSGNPQGGLLGSLLCDIADLNLGGLNLNRLINRVEHLIDHLGDLTNNLDKLTKAVDRLTDQLEHLADQLSHRLDHLVDQLNNVIDRLQTAIDNLPTGSNQLDKLAAQLDKIVDQLNTLIGRLT